MNQILLYFTHQGGKLLMNLTPLDQVKYRGTYSDKRLNWKAYINYLCQKLPVTKIPSAL